jgi:hypothetical protein
MKKKTKEIFEDIESLIIIVLIWSILTTIFPLTDYLNKTLSSVISWIVNFGIFGYLGYRIVSEKKDEKYAAKAGAYLGAIIGLAGAVLSLLTFYFFPERIASVIQAAIDKGADRATVELFIKIGLYVNFIIVPIFSAAFGAFLTWLSALIFKKK